MPTKCPRKIWPIFTKFSSAFLYAARMLASVADRWTPAHPKNGAKMVHEGHPNRLTRAVRNTVSGMEVSVEAHHGPMAVLVILSYQQSVKVPMHHPEHAVSTNSWPNFGCIYISEAFRDNAT